jgi:hypothetical protein
MSDFPTRLSDGKLHRIELIACTSRADEEPDINLPTSITQVIRYVSLYPFMQQIGISYYHVVELPVRYQSRWGNRILLIPPFLLKDFAFFPLMGQQVSVIGMIRITDQDFATIMSEGPERLFDSWDETLETWLFDTEKRALRRPERNGLLGRFFGRR